MLLGAFLLLPLVAMAIVAMPVFRYSRNWGYVPSGGLSVIVISICAIFLQRIS
jgi:low affinity Fe/Cu permease